MWITSKGLAQETIVDPHTGLKKIVSVKVSGNGKKAEQEAFRRLQDKIEKLGESHFKLSEIIDLYIRDQEKEWKPSTRSQVECRLHSVLSIVGDAYMDKLTAGYIRKKLTESGKNNQTINQYQDVFKTFWKWAYRNDYVQTMEVHDKLTSFRTTPKAYRIQDKYLETPEVEKLFNAMTDRRYYLFSKFALLTGMRVGEIIALNDVDCWGSIIRINKTWDKANHIVTSTKTVKSAREIHIQPELRECIDEIREYMKHQREVFGYNSELFFPDADGTHFKYGSYNKYLGRLTTEVLGRRLGCHVFRHSHASILAMRGMSLEAISERLGHDGSKITREIYLHRMKELKDLENRQLDKIRLLNL